MLLTLVLLQSEGKGSGIMLACFVLEEYKGRVFLFVVVAVSKSCFCSSHLL